MQIDNFLPSRLPQEFSWVDQHAQRRGPNIVREALKNFGLKEIKGSRHSQEILDMAGYLGGVIEDFYTRDEIPWCGLAVSYWIARAGFEPPKNYSQVRARDFATWGIPANTPSFGDILVFWRGDINGRDGHVGLYIAEDPDYYYVLGGNQSNMVRISPIAKDRLLDARRCPWRIRQPDGVQPFRVATARMNVSRNEA